MISKIFQLTLSNILVLGIIIPSAWGKYLPESIRHRSRMRLWELLVYLGLLIIDVILCRHRPGVFATWWYWVALGWAYWCLYRDDDPDKWKKWKSVIQGALTDVQSAVMQRHARECHS